MADIHVEDFYKDAARILVQLYNAFPRKTTVYVEDISGPDTPDEYGIHSARHQACFACMLWLCDEGYLRYLDTIRQEAVDQAVLSHKGFILLSGIARHVPSTTADSELPPSVAEEMHTNIALVRRVLAEGSSTDIARLMRELLTT